MPKTDDAVFYQIYFQSPGVAEAELERDPRLTIRSLLYTASGDAPRREGAQSEAMVPRNGGFLAGMQNPAMLPSWLPRPTSTSTRARSRAVFAAA